MAKKAVEDNIAEIKKAIVAKTIILGTQETMQAIRNGKCAKVFITENCPDSIVADVKYYAEHAKIPYVLLKETNESLGVICKKPYSVSLAALTKV